MVSSKDSIIAALTIFLVLDGAAVAARVYVRTVLRRGFGMDDAALCLTFLGYVFVCAMCFTSMRFGYAATDKQPGYDKAKADKYYFATQLCCYISSGLVKIAVALVLIRLANTRVLRWILYISMVLITIWSIVMTLFTSWLCAAGGTSNYASSYTCGIVGQFRTISNIVIDYFYALLPIWMLWKVQMTWKLKATAMFLLSLGIFASSATIVKLVVVTQLKTATGALADKLHYDLLLWAIIELGMAILAASAAALRPLLKHIPLLWESVYGQSRSKVSVTKSSTSANQATGPYVVVSHGYELETTRRMSGGTPRDLERGSWLVETKAVAQAKGRPTVTESWTRVPDPS